MFELNEKCLIPLGYVIKTSPVGTRDEKWIVLYKAYKTSQINIQGEEIAVLYLRQVTKFRDGILRGNPGWSDFKQKYIAVFSESIEQEVDKVILPAVQQGKLPFEGVRGSREFANVQELAEISLQLLQAEFSGKSRQEIVEMIEESTKKATSFAVFEPNDATTWLKVKGMIESYLYGLWERGALAGPTPETAYYVNVGLGKTMTAQDILEGRMIVEIGVAAVRPAEFIIIRFMHKLQEA